MKQLTKNIDEIIQQKQAIVDQKRWKLEEAKVTEEKEWEKLKTAQINRFKSLMILMINLAEQFKKI